MRPGDVPDRAVREGVVRQARVLHASLCACLPYYLYFVYEFCSNITTRGPPPNHPQARVATATPGVALTEVPSAPPLPAGRLPAAARDPQNAVMHVSAKADYGMRALLELAAAYEDNPTAW